MTLKKNMISYLLTILAFCAPLKVKGEDNAETERKANFHNYLKEAMTYETYHNDVENFYKKARTLIDYEGYPVNAQGEFDRRNEVNAILDAINPDYWRNKEYISKYCDDIKNRMPVDQAYASMIVRIAGQDETKLHLLIKYKHCLAKSILVAKDDELLFDLRSPRAMLASAMHKVYLQYTDEKILDGCKTVLQNGFNPEEARYQRMLNDMKIIKR